MADVEEILGSPDMGTIMSCPVCREAFNITDRAPINIPCGHTVCSVCMPILVGPRLPQFMVCPVCRKGHYPARARDTLEFPKNWQLLGIIEKMMEVKKKQNERADPIPLIKCRECNMEVPEFELTTCSCVKPKRCMDVDFIGRPHNSLICVDCISNHSEHEHKPVAAVKTAWDCRNAMNDLQKISTKLRDRSDVVNGFFDNAKKQLAYLVTRTEKTIKRLDARPRDQNLVSVAGSFYEKLEKINESLQNIRNSVHDMNTAMGAHTNVVRDYAVRPIPISPPNRQPPPPGIVDDPNVPAGAPQVPIGDDGVLRIGNNGHFQLQFRVALNEGLPDGFQGDADRLVDNVVQRRLNDLIPMLREHLENGQGNDGEVELRPIHRRVQLQRVGEGEEGIVVEMPDGPIPFFGREEDGVQQLVAGPNLREIRMERGRVNRRIQRAYELLDVQAEQANQNADEDADEALQNEEAVEEQNEPRGRAARNAQNRRGARAAQPYPARARGGRRGPGARGGAARNTRANAARRN